MIQQKRLLLSVTVSSVLTLVTACTDLTAVREWSSTSLEATQYNEVVNNYANTLERLKRYDPKQSAEDIATRLNQLKALKKILAIVSDYMSALATLSSDNIVVYTEESNVLTQSISKLNPNISKDTLGAAGTLVDTIAGAAAKPYRAKQVAIIVGEANEPLQKILKGDLRETIAENYRIDLTNEKTKIGQYYFGLLTDPGCPASLGEWQEVRLEQNTKKSNARMAYLHPKCPPPPSAAASAALSEWQEVRLEQNTKKSDARMAYLQVLDKISEGHQKLYDSRNSLDTKKLVKELQSLVKVLREQIKIISQSQN